MTSKIFFQRALLICSIFFCAIPTIAKNTKFSIELVPGVGFNFHKGNFAGIPDKSCCSRFEQGIGNGVSFGLNAQMNLKNRFFNKAFTPFIQISYMNSSGLFETKEYFANFIFQNEVFQAISRHSFDAKIHSLEFLIGNEFNSILFVKNLFLRFGISFSLPIEANYIQQEELISPSMAFFENGKKFRGHIDSKIPNALPQFNLAVFFRYGAFKYNSLEFSPILGFRFPLTQVAKNIDWKYYRIDFGIAIRHIIPEPKTLPPINPPLPEVPNVLPPPQSKPIIFNIIVSAGNRTFDNGDTIEIQRKIEVSFFKEFIPPVLFFERNDFALKLESIELTSSIKQQQEANIRVLEAVVKYLKQNPSSKLKIISSRLDDELNNTSNLRLIQVIEYLRQNGINTSNISTEEKVYKKDSFPYPELANEYRRVSFLFDGNTKILEEQQLIKTDTLIEPIRVDIQPEVKESKEKNIEVYGKVILPNSEKSLHNESLQITIDSGTCLALPCSFRIEAIAKSKEIEYEPRILNKEIHLVFNDIIKEIEEPLKGNKNLKYFLVGLCDFDQSQFYWINPNIANILDSLTKSGKKCKIIGSVDNFGNEGYNQTLAIRRAKNALKVLKANLPIETGIEINFEDNEIQNRILRRSAWVIVEN